MWLYCVVSLQHWILPHGENIAVLCYLPCLPCLEQDKERNGFDLQRIVSYQENLFDSERGSVETASRPQSVLIP